MTEQSTAPQEGSESSQEPGFRIQRIYLKDLSLEQPNAPKILLIVADPQVEVEVDIAVTPLNESIFEVALSATVTAKVDSKILFLVELSKRVFLSSTIFHPSKSIQCWVLGALPFCTHTFDRISPTLLVALDSSQFISMKSTFTACMSSV